MSPLVRALKAKYGNDKQKVMRLLGIDAELLKNASEEGRAESSKPLPRDDEGRVDPVALRVKLEKLLCEHLSSEPLERARSMLEQHLGGSEYDRVFDSEEDDDDKKREQDTDPKLERIARFLRERGMSEDDIAQGLKLAREHMTLPRNATAGGMGGELATQETLDRRLARDEHRRLAAHRALNNFHQRWPESARLAGDTGLPAPTPAPTSPASLERFPDAGRIGVA